MTIGRSFTNCYAYGPAQPRQTLAGDWAAALSLVKAMAGVPDEGADLLLLPGKLAEPLLEVPPDDAVLQLHVGAQRLPREQREEGLANGLVGVAVHEGQIVGAQYVFGRGVHGHEQRAGVVVGEDRARHIHIGDKDHELAQDGIVGEAWEGESA